MFGQAILQGVVNLGLRKVPWAPATPLTGSNLANGWVFNPNSPVAMPQNTNTGPFQMSNATGKLTRVEQAIFNRTQGCLTSFLNPGTTGGSPGLGVSFYNNRLTLLTNNGASNIAFLGSQNDGLPQTSYDFSHAGFFLLPTPSVVLVNQPIPYRNALGTDQIGILYGTVGLDQLNVIDPYTHTNLLAIDTTPTGAGNPPFFIGSAQVINAINTFNLNDYVNRLFVGHTPNNNGPWLFLWQDQLIGAQVLLQPTFDNAVMNAALQSSVNLTVQSWPGGFLVGVFTGGTGPTKQQTEWALVDINWTGYYLLNMIAEDASASLQLSRTGLSTMAFDQDGTIWYNSRNVSDTLTPLIGGFVTPSPISNGPIPANNPIDLPCFNPCVSNP